MIKIFTLINHILTQRQLKELNQLYGADCKIIYPPQDIKDYWAQVPPLPILEDNQICEITQWLEQANKGDVLLVQGDFGATFTIVDYALKKGLIPIQSVTKRVETEEYDGEKVFKHYIFMHECFRKYTYWE